MKITKSQLNQIIKEEISNTLMEGDMQSDGEFSNGVEWEVSDNGLVCFEKHFEDDYSTTSLCVPIEELRDALSAEDPSAPSAKGGYVQPTPEDEDLSDSWLQGFKGPSK